MPKLFVTALTLLALLTSAHARPKKDPVPPAPAPDAPTQKEADRYFKSGVALFKEAKYAEALAEFERAYEIAPHPLVLYNIAGCHRELSHYGEAVKFYERFLAEGKGEVPAARLTTAQTELAGILARIARVSISVTPEVGAAVIIDGAAIGTLPLEAPLILAPGEHKLVIRAERRPDLERTLRLASGDEVMLELTLPPATAAEAVTVGPRITRSPRRFAIGAGFGTNLRRAPDSGAPSVGLGIALGSRLELGVDAVLVAYAVMPSIRVRLLGSALSLHAVAAVPVAFTDDEMTDTFVGGAVGLGLRYRPTPGFALRLESFASYAGKDHGTTIPTFLGGELWF